MEPSQTAQAPDEKYRTTQPPASTYPAAASRNNASSDERDIDRDV